VIGTCKKKKKEKEGLVARSPQPLAKVEPYCLIAWQVHHHEDSALLFAFLPFCTKGVI